MTQITTSLGGASQKLSIKGKDALAALAKGAPKLFAQDYLGALSAAKDLFKSIDIKDTNQSRLYHLLLPAIAQATDALLKNHSGYQPAENFDFQQAFKNWGGELELTVDDEFFDRPHSQPFVTPIQDLLKEMLSGAALPGRDAPLTEADAQSLKNRWPAYLASALHEVWGRDPDRFEPLFKTLRSRFSSAMRRDQDWARVRARMALLAEEPVFQESFGLRQVFVPLRGYCGGPDLAYNRIYNAYRFIPNVTAELTAWAQTRPQKAEDALRVVTGGPGSGKSSILKMVAAALAKEGVNCLYIPLRKLQSPGQNFNDALIEMAQAWGLRDIAKVQDLYADPMTLLLDGLDELELSGETGRAQVDACFNAINHLLNRSGFGQKFLTCILAGRELAVQSFNALGKGAVIHLYSYVVEYGHREKIPKEHQIDQRPLWWKQYGEVTGRPGTLLNVRDNKALDELSRQPLLAYLLALADRDKALSNIKTINDVYRILIEDVFRRDWDHLSGPGHPATENLKPDHFLLFLEMVAVAAWHGDTRTATVKDVQDLAGTLPVTIEEFDLCQGNKVSGLMLAFYFTSDGAKSNRRYEFTHKSFGEYLTACHLLKEAEAFLKKKEEAESQGRDWSKDEALRRWLRLCGSTMIDRDLIPFLTHEVASWEKEQIISVRDCCCALFEMQLDRSWPVDGPADRVGPLARRAAYAEHALLTLLCVLGTAAGELKITWPAHKRAPQAMIDRFEESILFRESCFYLKHFTALPLCGQYFSSVDLSLADLSGADLSDAGLSRAFLSHANLSRAILCNARLSSVDLSSSDLSGADLSGADLSRADLSDANLSDANLSDANLSDANLSGANLSDANLSRADLSGANLSNANLFCSNLFRADLSGANLSNANLSCSNLSCADLSNARLSGADLSGVDLFCTSFYEATGTPKKLPPGFDWERALGTPPEGSKGEALGGGSARGREAPSSGSRWSLRSLLSRPRG